MKMKSRCVQLLVNVLALSWCAEAGPLVWRQPEQLTSNATCRVTVDGVPVDVLALPKPPDIYLKGEQCQPYEAAMFDSDDESDVSVVFPYALESGNVRVLPLSAGIKPRIEGKRVSFRARPPFNLVVEPHGRHRALVVSAKRRETFVPDRNDPKVKWLDPGVHRGEMQLYSGQTLYLAPGAVFEGNLVAVGKNITVCGRGAFSGIPWGWDKGPSRQCWQFRGEHIAIRDVAFLGGWYWQVVVDSAKDVCIDGIRIFGARVVNDDGIDICRSQDVVVRNAFIRTQDDCVALKWWCRNVLVENCVLWTDFATVSRLGWECDPQLGEAMENVVFRDLDILHLSQAKRPASHEWPNPAFLIQASNGLPIRDVRLERIRFDTVEPGDLMLIAYSGTCGDPGRTGVCYPGGGSVDRVLLKDFTVPEGSVKMGVRLDACDEKSPISNIVFENVECCEEAVLRNAQAPTVRKANGDFPVFRAGDRVAWIGDSIASNGHRTPSGYINAVIAAAEATGTPGFDNVIGLGFGGWHVYGWHAYERKSLTDPTLPSRFDKVPTMGDVFTNRLDVIVLALGINDHGFPTFPNDDLKIWQDEYDRFISDLKERCRPRRLVICNTTAHTCDPEAAANRRLERMNVLIRELAERHGAVHVDMHAAIWETIDRVRQMKTGLRDLQDFIHPRAVGNAAMARQFCLDIGETKMAEWLSGELERRYAALDARAGDKPRLVCRLRPDRSGSVAGCPYMNYDILWNLNGADRASVGICVPEGWRTSVIRQTQSNGVIRVCGRPDRLTNRVTVTADLDGRVLEEVIDIPAPWLISSDFAFESAWKGSEWQRKEAPPVDVKDVCGWKVHTQTWDYAGDNDPSAIDLRAVNTGYPNGAAYVRRWLYAPRALKLKLVVGTQFWSACNAVRVWLDGKVVAETVLRSGWVDGKPYSCDDKTYPLVLEPGWHDLTALTANRMFDHYFHIRILDEATGKEPSELRIGCGWTDSDGKERGK